MASKYQRTDYGSSDSKQAQALNKATIQQSCKSGYECDFVEKPPDVFQTECPICLNILRDPYQVTCCGKNYCCACIKQLKKRKCPTCKKGDINAFKNKGLKQSLIQMKVYCSHRSEGCLWTGELGQFDSHLNSNPTQSNQLEGCPFLSIQCLHCSETFPRSKIMSHQNDLCQKRPSSCKHCGDYASTHEDVKSHWHVCGSFPVVCPSKCGKSILRRKLEQHVNKHCPLTVIDCDFKNVGCKVRSSRKDMAVHMETAAATHECLEMRVRVARLEEKVDVMAKQAAEREQTLVRRLEKNEEKLIKHIEELRQALSKKMEKGILNVNEETKKRISGMEQAIGRSIEEMRKQAVQSEQRISAQVETWVKSGALLSIQTWSNDIEPIARDVQALNTWMSKHKSHIVAYILGFSVCQLLVLVCVIYTCFH